MKGFMFFSIVLVLWLANTVSAAASLRGSPSALEHQNKQADLDNLSRLTEKNLESFKKKGLLVPLPDGKFGIVVDPKLPEKYRFCRPWTRRFLVDLGKDFEKKFGKPLQVNSAVRTVEYQKELRGKNRNAASAQPGPLQSSHPTGAAVDITKKNMSPDERRWMRERLTALEKKGLVEATEEFRQKVFHVMVFKKYSAPKKTR